MSDYKEHKLSTRFGYLALLVFCLYFITGVFAHAQTYVEKQNAAHINLLENAGFESSLAKWSKTVSGSSTTVMHTNFPLTGKVTLRLQPNAGDANVCSNYYPVNGLKNGNAELSVRWRSDVGVSGTALIKVQDVSGTVLTQFNLVNTGAEVGLDSKLFAFGDKNVRTCIETTATSPYNYVIDVDDVWMGSPRNVVQGPVQTNWENYTPTFTSFGSVTNINFAYKQVGDSIFIRGYFTPGTVAAAVASISLPKSFVAQATGGIILAGLVEIDNVHNTKINAVYANGDTSLYFSCSDGTAPGLAKQNASLCFASNKNTSFTIGPIKIQGLGGTATAFGRNCKDVYECENNFTSAILASGAVSSSTVAGWVSSGAPSSAVFPLTFKAGLFSAPPICHCTNNGGVSSGDNECNIFNITATGASAHTSVANAASAQNFSITCTRSTDYVQKKVIQGYLSEQRIAVSYYASSNKSASTTQPIDFDTKELDATNCNCVTTGSGWKFTAPKSSVYSVSISQVYSTTTGSSYITIYKNNTAYKNFSFTDGSASTADSTTLIKLDAGDYIDLRPNASKTFFGNALNAISTMRAMISITEVSN